jgi:polyhydroxyalkanoate synthase subunit PhaC
VKVGRTPSDVLYQDGRMRVLHYHPPSSAPPADRPPALFVYALINKPYILDLLPGLSVVETLLARGIDVYLIDWGTPTILDQDKRIHDYVNGYIAAAVQATREAAGTDQIHLIGYCMGGTFSAMYAALQPEGLATLSVMAAPLDFDTQASFLNVWAHAPGFDAWKIARTYRLIPPEFLSSAFGMLDPLRTNYLKFLGLFDHLDDPPFIENFLAMERWNNDGIPMAGPTYAEFIDKGFQRNLLVRGEWTLDGDDRTIDLGRIRVPMATIVGLNDNLVPPECTERVLQHVGSTETQRFSHPSGHIGLSTSRRAHQDLWPRFAGWLKSHPIPRRTSAPRRRRSRLVAARPRSPPRRRRS